MHILSIKFNTATYYTVYKSSCLSSGL